MQLSGSIVLSRFGVGAGEKPGPARKSPLPIRRGVAMPEQRADKWTAGRVPGLGSFAAIVADRVFGDLALNCLFSGGAAAQQAPFVKQYDIIGERQHRGTMGDHDHSATGGFLVGNHFPNDSLGRSVKVCRGFIEQQNSRLSHDCARQRYSLPLATR